MKRHPALVPLSHDHHHALVEARRLRRAPDASRVAAARAFLEFFGRESTEHFRDEEELLFPLAPADGPAGELVRQALLDHGRLRGLARALERAADAAAVPEALAVEIADALGAHVRLEERELFPLLEAGAGPAELELLALRGRRPTPAEPGSPVVDLLSGQGRGPVWGTATDDLNATLLAWRDGEGTPEQVNAERDVLLVAVHGAGAVELGGERHGFHAGQAVLVQKGSRFRVVAGRPGLRYLAVHLRRPGLQIGRAKR